MSRSCSPPRNLIPAALLVLLLAARAASAAQPLVTGIQVTGVKPEEAAQIVELLDLQEGQPIDRRHLRETVSTLYASGKLEWLRVESKPSDGGIVLTIDVSFRTQISKIVINTKRLALRVRVSRWLQLEEGETVSVAAVEANRRRVERKLQDRGYFEAVVDAFINYDRATNSAVVEFDVTPGEPRVVGTTSLGAAEGADIGEALPEVKRGARLTAKLEEKLRNRTEANLRRMGYWEAEVLEIRTNGQGAEVDVVVEVDTGPLYELEIVAPAEQAKAAERAFPDPVEEEIHPAQTDALAEQVHEKLQESGFLLSSVKANLEITDAVHTVRLDIDPGLKQKVASVEFPGAESLDWSRLTAVVEVHPGSTGGRFGQEISAATLEADRAALESLYHSEGFPDASVATPVLEPDGTTSVNILFPVEEGQRWLLTDLRVEGLPVETAAELESRPLGLAEGDPWSTAAVEKARQRLQVALADTGYPEGRVEAETDTSQPGRVSVVYRVEPGEYVLVGKVIISGLRHTRPSLVAGYVRRAGVVPGAPLSNRQLLEARRSLYELGLFRFVELVPMPGQEHRQVRNIVVRCEEGEQKSYLFGVGYSDTDAARIILGWSHLNLFGGAHAFAAEVSLSSNEQRYSLSLRERRTLGLNVPSYLAIYRTYEVLADYNLLRRGLWIDFGDRLKRPLRPWLRYDYEIIENTAPPEILEELERQDLQSKVASITPTLEWDTRDNPLAPTRGIFASTSLQYAFPLFDADANFLNAYAGGTVYKPVLRGFAAAGLRLNFIKPLNGSSDVPANLQIPLGYRIFAGGRNSHRAFATDMLGIPGQTIIDGNPIGGNALILLNLEYRRRIQGEFFAVAFVDAGNVWASYSDVNFGDIRWGVGLGLQYRTPAGPLRAEYGWKLDRLEGESSGQFFISFGVPF